MGVGKELTSYKREEGLLVEATQRKRVLEGLPYRDKCMALLWIPVTRRQLLVKVSVHEREDPHFQVAQKLDN